jgi:bifunctional non-homologous end joining protein LigD
MPYQHTDRAQYDTGVRPQLCNPIEAEEVKDYLVDSAFLMQEKFDGKRLLIHSDPDGITAINRKGLSVNLSESICKAAKVISVPFILDGECIGDVFHAFDVLLINQDNLRA